MTPNYKFCVLFSTSRSYLRNKVCYETENSTPTKPLPHYLRNLTSSQKPTINHMYRNNYAMPISHNCQFGSSALVLIVISLKDHGKSAKLHRTTQEAIGGSSLTENDSEETGSHSFTNCKMHCVILNFTISIDFIIDCSNIISFSYSSIS